MQEQAIGQWRGVRAPPPATPQPPKSWSGPMTVRASISGGQSIVFPSSPSLDLPVCLISSVSVSLLVFSLHETLHLSCTAFPSVSLSFLSGAWSSRSLHLDNRLASRVARSLPRYFLTF